MSEENKTAKKPGIEPAVAHNLQELLPPMPDSVLSRILHKNAAGNVTFFSFGEGQGLSTHTAPFDAFVLVTNGKAQVTIDKDDHEVNTGQCILMPANIPHSVQALQDFQMLLVMLKSTPV